MPSNRLFLARFSIILAPHPPAGPEDALADPDSPWGCYQVTFNEAGLACDIAAEMAVNHLLDHLHDQVDLQALAHRAQLEVFTDEGAPVRPASTAARSRSPVTVVKLHNGLHGPEWAS